MGLVIPPPEGAQFVRDYLTGKFPHIQAIGGYQSGVALGYEEDGLLKGAVLIDHMSPFSCEITAYAETPRMVSRSRLKYLFWLIFGEFGLKRCAAVTAPKNHRARRLLHGMGFKQEGKARRGLDGTRDAIVYAMTIDDCPWLEN